MKCECGYQARSTWHDGNLWTCPRCGVEWEFQPVIIQTPAGALRQDDRFHLNQTKRKPTAGWLVATGVGGDVRSGIRFVTARAENGNARTIFPDRIHRIDFDARPRIRAGVPA